MRKFWIELRSSLWFVPAVLVLASSLLALGSVELDVRFADQLKPWGWMPFLNAGAEGARGMLTAIASSMITVAGVAFSITIVALSLASTQYTPRILRNFMRDRANQSVLGVFVGIYAYCLIVLRTIRGGAEGGGFVPLLAVFFGVLLALLGIAYLIFFIHHIASSIQASSILEAITKETLDSMDLRFPDEYAARAESEPAVRPPDLEGWQPIPSPASGYLQSVGWKALSAKASEAETTFWLAHVVGDFVVEDAPLIFSKRVLQEDHLAGLATHFAIGNFRTVDQDPSFGIRQIVDIAMKALSPGINDTSTAVACVDFLSAILCRLAARRMDFSLRDSGQEPRILAPPARFADYLAKSLDEIRLNAAGNISVIVQLLHLLTRVAQVAPDPLRKSSLLEHARLIVQMADRTVPVAYDRERINQTLASTRHALDAAAQLPPLPHSRGELAYLGETSEQQSL